MPLLLVPSFWSCVMYTCLRREISCGVCVRLLFLGVWLYVHEDELGEATVR